MAGRRFAVRSNSADAVCRIRRTRDDDSFHPIVSKYQLELPRKEEIQRFLEAQMREAQP
jgi:hypothetical protein